MRLVSWEVYIRLDCQLIPNISYAFTEKGGFNSCAVCFIKFTYYDVYVTL